MSYITESDLENFIIQDIDSSYSAWIASVIAYIEDYIEQYTGLVFDNSASATQYFDGIGGDILTIGEYQSLTSVQTLDSSGNVMETLVDGTDYVGYPYNDATKNSLKLLTGGQRSCWPEWDRSVKITGVFGYTTVPGPVKVAAVKLAAKVINEGLKGGQVSQESLGSYSVTYRELDESVDSLGIKEILNQYRRMTLV